MELEFDNSYTKSAVPASKDGDQIDVAKLTPRILRGRVNEYEYTRLELSDTVKIRRLKIEPGLDDAPITCSLTPSSLEEPYEALSYVWGAGEPTEEIRIQERRPIAAVSSKPSFPKLRYRSFYFRPNLYAALRNFRSNKKHVDLWIDALCINQEDDEKEIQIAMMEDIYSKATRVLIWLGEPKDFTPKAFACIESMCDLSLFDGLLKDVESHPLLHALGQLMKDVWFSRRWVVQELAMAKEASLHCGWHNIHWVDFADAIAFYVMSYDRIKSLPQAPLPPY
jgi:hypothetical protein